MKTGIMAHEQLLIPGAIGNGDFMTEGEWLEPMDINDALARQQIQHEANGYSADLNEHFQAVDLVDQVTDLVESEQGLSAPVCEALKLAINQLTRSTGSQLLTPAFEEQVTQRTKARNAQVVLESLKELGKKIWQSILDMLRRFAAWFNRTFNAQALHAKVQKERAAHAQAKLDEARKEPPKPTGEESKTFVDPALSRVLAIDGMVPHGSALLQAAQAHIHLITQLNSVAEANDREIIKHLEAAFEAIDSKNNHFQTPMGEAFSSLGATILSRKATGAVARTHNRRPGIEMYEQALIFGGQSYFRAAVTGKAQFSDQLDGYDLTAFISHGSNDPTMPDQDQKLVLLTIDQAEALLHAVRKHYETMESWRHEADHELSARLSELQRKAGSLMMQAGDLDTRTNGRIKQLSKAVTLFLHLRRSIVSDLYNYDAKVMDKLLSYATRWE